MTKPILAFAFSVLSVSLAACAGGDKSCTELCTEGQAGSCTAITGNCGSFCAALDTIDGPANCTSQRDAYESCLNGAANVCDSNCTNQENALSSCITAYCLGHASDASCQTLASSF